jgi:mitogen-activated protein kinase kinase kinase
VDLPPDLLERYEPVGPLGKGGMSVVLRARHRQLKREVALKLCAPLGGDGRDRKRFLAEGRLAARIQHPNVCRIFECGESANGDLYIAYELVEGTTLVSLLGPGRKPVGEVLPLMADVLRGLQAIHDEGVIHRDIKPENILLDHDGVIKFVDFGAAKMIARQGKTLAGAAAAGGPGGAELLRVHQPQHAASQPPKLLPGAAPPAAAGGAGGRQNSMQGTPMYMAPEVIRGSAPGRTGAADVWSLGCVVLEMVTGRRPWASLDNEWAIMYNIAQGNTPQLPVREHMTDAGISFLARCFDRDPARRASAVELLQDPWIVEIRAQLALDPATPASEGSVGSALASRQNSMTLIFL